MAALRKIIGILIVGVSVLTGCTQPDPAGQPTYSCTPDDGSSPYACYKAQYDAKAKEAALYAEAEQVYRKYLAEDERIHRAGGVTEPTPVLLETTTGLYLKYAMDNYRRLHGLGIKLTSGAYQIAWIRRAPGKNRSGSIVAMTSCVDASQATLMKNKGGSEPGARVRETAFFVRDASSLKLTDTLSETVPQC